MYFRSWFVLFLRWASTQKRSSRSVRAFYSSTPNLNAPPPSCWGGKAPSPQTLWVYAWLPCIRSILSGQLIWTCEHMPMNARLGLGIQNKVVFDEKHIKSNKDVKKYNEREFERIQQKMKIRIVMVSITTVILTIITYFHKCHPTIGL